MNNDDEESSGAQVEEAHRQLHFFHWTANAFNNTDYMHVAYTDPYMQVVYYCLYENEYLPMRKTRFATRLFGVVTGAVSVCRRSHEEAYLYTQMGPGDALVVPPNLRVSIDPVNVNDDRVKMFCVVMPPQHAPHFRQQRMQLLD